MLELFPGLADTQVAVNRRVVETGEPLTIDAQRYPNETFGGQERFYDIRAAKLGDGLFYSWRDVTDRHLAVQRIAESEERYRLLAENAADIVLVIKDGVVDWISPSVERAFGSPPLGLGWAWQPMTSSTPMTCQSFVTSCLPSCAGKTSRSACAAVGAQRRRALGGGSRAALCRGGRPDLPASSPATTSIDEVIQAEAELDRRARFDSLTGLLNRPEILSTITQVATRTPRSGTQTAVLFCDVDRFKDINDDHGHAAGDEVLRTVGERVAATIRADDYAARIGGDELLILLPGVHSLDEAIEVAEKIRSIAAQRIALDHGVGITPQLSVGVTLLRLGETTDDVVERADSAMYLAKKSGRNRVVAV